MAERASAGLWGEARMAGELAALLRHPVYAGKDLPRGDGRAVVVLPGLFANDFYLEPMHRWLKRIGYRPLRSTLLLNAGCPQRLREQIEDHLHLRTAGDVRPIALIGHSRGGILAWAVAAALQERVSHLVLLGSPAPAVARAIAASSLSGAGMANEAVQRAGARARQILDPDCDVPACGCPFPRDMQRLLHASTRVVSIFSRDDPVVPPAASRVSGGRNFEVRGTHGGLAYNIGAYKVIATSLSE